MLSSMPQQKNTTDTKQRVLQQVIESARKMQYATIILHVERGELRRIEGPAPIIKLPK